jgi:LytS/YehU family sensor histidine kinase
MAELTEQASAQAVITIQEGIIATFMSDFSMYRGNSKRFNFAITLGGVAENLTSKLIFFSVRRNPSAPLMFTKSLGSGIIVTNAAGGLGYVDILPADTEALPSRETSLEYDLEYVDGSNVTTADKGTITVLPDITVR